MAKRKVGSQIGNLTPTTKSQELPQFPYVQVECDTLLKSSGQGLQLSLDLISIRGPHAKLWAPKVARIPTLGILGLPLGSFGTK